MMTYRMPRLLCCPEKQSLDARCWPKFRCTEARRTLIVTSTATTTLGAVEVAMEGLSYTGKHRAQTERSSPET